MHSTGELQSLRWLAGRGFLRCRRVARETATGPGADDRLLSWCIPPVGPGAEGIIITAHHMATTHDAGGVATIARKVPDKGTGLLQPLAIHETFTAHLLHGPAIRRQFAATNILVRTFVIIDQQFGAAGQIAQPARIENDQPAAGGPVIGIAPGNKRRYCPAFDNKAVDHQLSGSDQLAGRCSAERGYQRQEPQSGHHDSAQKRLQKCQPVQFLLTSSKALQHKAPVMRPALARFLVCPSLSQRYLLPGQHSIKPVLFGADHCPCPVRMSNHLPTTKRGDTDDQR